MEQIVNTMTISLAEYKQMMDENSALVAKLAAKDELLKAKDIELGAQKEKVSTLKSEISKAENTIWVRPINEILYTNIFGTSLQKSDPILTKIIEGSVSEETKSKIKEQEKLIEKLREEIEYLQKENRKERIELKEKQQAIVKELNEKIETLTKDYNDLKLDKAANLVEAERLAEVKALQEQLHEIEVGKSIDDFVWPKGPISWMFRKQIKEIATNMYNYLRTIKVTRTVDTTSAYGKAKDYLKTLDGPKDNAYHYGASTWCGTSVTASW